jgi:predicted dehydrogenase
MLTVFHNRRWDRDFQMVRALVERGVLGDLLTVDSRIYMAGDLYGAWGTYGITESWPNWRLEAAYGGGYLADWAPHMVDQCVTLVGDWPTAVWAMRRSDVWTHEVDDYFAMHLTFPSGPAVTLEASNNSRMAPPRWFVVGRKGALTAPGEWARWPEIQVRADLDGILTELSPQEMVCSATPRRYGTGDSLSDHFYSDLYEALTSGRGPSITAEYARDIMIVIDAARRSDASGQVVELTW